jgi:hypothetical protein
MGNINNFNLQKDYWNLQQQMYEDQKPSWLDDVLGGISAVSGVLPFLAEGGEVAAPGVQGSDYFHTLYNGFIPKNEINSAPASTGDNVAIMAKDGERIISPEADKLTFGSTQMINDAVKLMKELIH